MLGLLVAGGIAFVLIGLWMLGGPPQLARYDRMLVQGIALADIVFFAAASAMGMRKLFDRRPGLELTPEGFIDNSSGVSVGLVPWAEVTGLGVWELGAARTIVLAVRDPEKYVARGGPLRRRVNRANLHLCGSPVVVSSASLQIGFDELLELFKAYLARHGGRMA